MDERQNAEQMAELYLHLDCTGAKGGGCIFARWFGVGS